MTQLVFALIVTMGMQTISVKHWFSIQTCLWYAEQLNRQRHHVYHRHHNKRAYPREVHPGQG